MILPAPCGTANGRRRVDTPTRSAPSTLLNQIVEEVLHRLDPDGTMAAAYHRYDATEPPASAPGRHTDCPVGAA